MIRYVDSTKYRDTRPCIRCGNTTEPILVPCETPQCEDSVACAGRAKSSNSEPATEPGKPTALQPPVEEGLLARVVREARERGLSYDHSKPREDRLRALGFEEVSAEQSKANLAISVAELQKPIPVADVVWTEHVTDEAWRTGVAPLVLGPAATAMLAKLLAEGPQGDPLTSVRECGWCDIEPRDADLIPDPTGGWQCRDVSACMARVNAEFGDTSGHPLDRARYAAAQSAPRNLTPDPKDGTRAGWDWCASCAGIREPAHTCYPRKATNGPCMHRYLTPAAINANGEVQEWKCTNCGTLGLLLPTKTDEQAEFERMAAGHG